KSVPLEYIGHAKNCMAFMFDTDVNNRRYFIEMTELDHDLYVVKFYPKQYRHSEKKFNLIANDHNSFKVLGTCINVLLTELLLAKPDSSFLFHGVPKAKNSKHNFLVGDYEDTQRFRIYKYIIINRLGRQTFAMNHDPKLSLMCVLRRSKLNDEFEEYVLNVARKLTEELGSEPVFSAIDP
ncbi:MAG: hypothetical protein Q8J69_00910, partial [Sphingobacteriaceae bacterium]|nr:hypothetical protein [Sphingobacteriaceae bacterium]